MRLEHAPEFGEMGVVALTGEQQAAELVFRLLDGAGQCRLADVANFSCLGEVERLGDCQE
jgi:hypothetical protein